MSQVHTDKAVGISADNKTWSTNADASLASALGTAGSRNVALAFSGMSVGGDGSGKPVRILFIWDRLTWITEQVVHNLFDWTVTDIVPMAIS